jgi:hypothetical protein
MIPPSLLHLGTRHRLLMDTVEIKGSNLPGLRQAS